MTRGIERSFIVMAVATLGLLATGSSSPANAETISPGRFLSVYFDIVPTPWANQAEVYEPNLMFLEFRGGVTLSPKAIATATLFVDGVELGSTTGDDGVCFPLCSSTSWQFASPGFPSVPVFPNPTIIDFGPLLAGSHGVITLRIDSGSMMFGKAPYTENAPVVVLDNIASCGPGCTSIRPVTLDAQNLRYTVTAVPEASPLLLLSTGAFGLLAARHHRQRARALQRR